VARPEQHWSFLQNTMPTSDSSEFPDNTNLYALLYVPGLCRKRLYQHCHSAVQHQQIHAAGAGLSGA
jgi:hypothetical protein